MALVMGGNLLGNHGRRLAQAREVILELHAPGERPIGTHQAASFFTSNPALNAATLAAGVVCCWQAERLCQRTAAKEEISTCIHIHIPCPAPNGLQCLSLSSQLKSALCGLWIPGRRRIVADLYCNPSAGSGVAVVLSGSLKLDSDFQKAGPCIAWTTRRRIR